MLSKTARECSEVEKNNILGREICEVQAKCEVQEKSVDGLTGKEIFHQDVDLFSKKFDLDSIVTRTACLLR